MVLCSLCLYAVTDSYEADAAGIVFSCSVHSHRGHNSPASSNEEGGIGTRRVMTTSLMITFQLVFSHAHIPTPAMRAENTESVSAVRFALLYCCHLIPQNSYDEEEY